MFESMLGPRIGLVMGVTVGADRFCLQQQPAHHVREREHTELLQEHEDDEVRLQRRRRHLVFRVARDPYGNEQHAIVARNNGKRRIHMCTPLLSTRALNKSASPPVAKSIPSPLCQRT